VDGRTNKFVSAKQKEKKTSIFKKWTGTKCNTHLRFASAIQDRGNKRLINYVACKDLCLPGCAAVSMNEWFLTFGRNSVSPTSGSPKNNSQYGINGGEV
jgi:hypothetical protein